MELLLNKKISPPPKNQIALNVTIHLMVLKRMRR